MISAGVCIVLILLGFSILIFVAALTGCLVFLFVTVVKLLAAILGIPIRWTIQLNTRPDERDSVGPTESSHK